MADLVAFRSHHLCDRPQGAPLPPQPGHFPDRLLFGRDLDQLAVVASPEPKRNLPPKIPAPGLLVGLHLPNALPDAVALGLGKSGGDRQEQLGQAVA